MAYVTTGRTYDQGTVFAVDLDVAIKKYGSEDTYQGSRITYRDKDGGIQEAKIAQVWLNYAYQKDLKAKLSSLKSGDEVTIYKEKSAPAEQIEGKTAEEQKAVGNWGVKSILDGHVIPEEIAASRPAAAQGAAREPYDIKGIEVGHAINGAYRLLSTAKCKDDAAVIEAAKEVHNITIKIKGEYQVSSGLAKGKAGAAAGHAVLNACNLAKTIDEVEGIANGILKNVTSAVSAFVNGEDVPAESKASPKKADDAEASTNDSAAKELADDDIPF